MRASLSTIHDKKMLMSMIRTKRRIRWEFMFFCWQRKSSLTYIAFKFYHKTTKYYAISFNIEILIKFHYNVMNQLLIWFCYSLRKCNRISACILKQGISYIWHAAFEYFICPINKGLLVSFLEYSYSIVSIYHINWACRCIKMTMSMLWS